MLSLRFLSAEARYERAIQRQLSDESRYFGEVIRSTWERNGGYFIARSREGLDNPDRRKRGRKFRIEFQEVRGTEYELAYRIRTRRRGFFAYQSALPYGVRVIDLIHEDMLHELSRACDRKVELADLDYNMGTWIVVHRVRGMDRIPKFVGYTELMNAVGIRDENVVALGVREAREILTINLSEHPHLLIGGTTGGGKSNVLNLILAQAMALPASDLTLYLVDLKFGMEFGPYQLAPQVRRVITNIRDAVGLLKEVLRTVISRSKRLRAAGVRNIGEYNKTHVDHTLEQVWVVIDEYAELTLAQSKKIQARCNRILQRIFNLGRAAGVRVILCTQRPAVATVPNGFKINMSATVAGRTQNAAQSGVLVSAAGARADKLPKIPGRMLFETGQDFCEFQAAYINNDEIRAAVSHARGVHEGVIDRSGSGVQINPKGLYQWLLQHGPRVTGHEKKLAELGVKRADYHRFLEYMRKKGYIIRRFGVWILKLDYELPQLPRPTQSPPPPPPPPPLPEIIYLGNGQPPPPPQLQTPDQFLSVDHAVEMFIESHLERTGVRTDTITADDMYDLYVTFSEGRITDPGSKGWLGRRLKASGVTSRRLHINGRQCSNWTGVKFVKERKKEET